MNIFHNWLEILELSFIKIDEYHINLYSKRFDTVKIIK